MSRSFSKFLEITLAVAIGLAGLASWNYFKSKPLEAYQFEKSLLETSAPGYVADLLLQSGIACDDFQYVTPIEFAAEEAVCGSVRAPLRFYSFENPTKVMNAFSTRAVAPSCNRNRRQYVAMFGLGMVRSPSQALIEKVAQVVGGARLTIECVNR